MSTTPAGYLVGMVCPSRGVFASDDTLSPFSGGHATLAGIQRCVPLVRDGYRVGQIVAGETAYSSGVHVLAELVHGFKLDSRSRWLSPHFVQPHRAASARGRQVDFTDLELEYVQLASTPGVFNVSEAQQTLLDPRRSRGGYSFMLPPLTGTHRQVLGRMHGHAEFTNHRGGDTWNLCSLLMPTSHHRHHRAPVAPVASVDPLPAPAAVGSTRPSGKAMQRLADAGLDAAWTDERGRVVHSRRLGSLEVRS